MTVFSADILNGLNDEQAELLIKTFGVILNTGSLSVFRKNLRRARDVGEIDGVTYDLIYWSSEYIEVIIKK